MDIDFDTVIRGIRRSLKSKCPTLSVTRGRGTAYGWIDISGSGPWGRFTDEEREYLRSVGLQPGGNFCVIAPEDREYWYHKLGGDKC
jgi:hypothetical protein